MKPWKNTRLFALAKSELGMNSKIVSRCIQASTPRSKQQAQLGSTQLDNGLFTQSIEFSLVSIHTFWLLYICLAFSKKINNNIYIVF